MNKSSFFAVLSVVLISNSIASATPPAALSPTHMWTGVWEMKSPGKPGLTITLVDATGSLTGTIVFEVLNRQTGQRIAVEPRAIVKPHIEGGTLAFQVLRIARPHLKDDPNPEQVEPPEAVDMTLSAPSSEKATLTCLKCGENSSTELERIH